MREKVNDNKWIGQKYGRLTVTGFVHKGKKWYWECTCECGIKRFAIHQYNHKSFASGSKFTIYGVRA